MVKITNIGMQTREMKVLRGKSENATKMNLTAGKFNMVIDERRPISDKRAASLMLTWQHEPQPQPDAQYYRASGYPVC